jgi:hypothetical protein
MNDSQRHAFHLALRAHHARPFLPERDLVHGSRQQRERHRQARTALLDWLRPDARVLAAYDALSHQLDVTTLRDHLIADLDTLAREARLRSRAGLFDPETAPSLSEDQGARRDRLVTDFIIALDERTVRVVSTAETFRPLVEALRFPRWRWLSAELFSMFFDHQESLIINAQVTRVYTDVPAGAVADHLVTIRAPAGSSKREVERLIRAATERAFARGEYMPKVDGYVARNVVWFARARADHARIVDLAREHAAASGRSNLSHGFVRIAIDTAQRWLALGDRPALPAAAKRRYDAQVESMTDPESDD